jgi:maltooligosyltrehalose trehalohydrolase
MGAEPLMDGSTHFRVWAPDRDRVEVVVNGSQTALASEADGWFGGAVEGVRAGDRYRFRLDGAEGLLPDPASRFQPEGPEGPSEVIDPTTFEWTDAGWPGARLPGQVMYELHVGTFSREGTWAGAAARLGHLSELGVTLIELMPVAEFAGAFGWGYDGVDLFAPYHHYGRPDEMRAFVNTAHELGIGVILDVVYNHMGPVGNFLDRFGAAYLSARHVTDWGPPLNFDGPACAAPRELVLANAEHWIREYHLDGFRLDATQNVEDDSDRHILAELSVRARAAAGKRSILIVAENESQLTSKLRPPREGGWGLDALWNDDVHHSAIVALTGRKHSYYSDYLGSAGEMVATARHGFLYQGQYYPWQDKRRGEPSLGVPPQHFVSFLENHDQVANTERGERLATLAGPGPLRALTAFVLLGPETPLLFQGQEWGSTAPFVFFADHRGELGAAVRAGRLQFLEQFRTMVDADVRAGVPDPGSREQAFERCVLDWEERGGPGHARWLALHRDLLRLRREDRAIASGGRTGVDGAVLAPSAWLLRWPASDPADERLLIVNLGRELDYAPPSEPLLAPPVGTRWVLLWSSEAPAYGGRGSPEVEGGHGWVLPGPCAVLLGPVTREANDAR